MTRRPALPALLLAATTLAGCVDLAPHYERPANASPGAGWPQGESYLPVQEGRASELAWRDFIRDDKLKRVVQLALDNNRDLRAAVINIAEARALYRVQRADLLPTVGADASITREHSPAGLSGVGAVSTGGTTTAGTGSTVGLGTATTGTGAGTGAGVGGVGSTSVATGGGDFTIYSAALGVSAYELDLWGRVRNLTKQAFEQVLAAEEARRSVQISLVSEVAADYVTYGADLQRQKVDQETLKADLQSLEITEARFNRGVVSELDVRQAQTAVEQARTDLLAVTTQAAQDLNALTLLVGAPVPAELLPAGQDETLPTLADVPAGLASSVLLDRPDVLQAEHVLKGYNADIGAARAAFFPTLSLTTSVGTTSLSLGNLFAPGTGTWTVAPSLTLPIFDGGRNRANLAYVRAEREAAVAQYEKTVQTAFREAADALAQRGTAVAQIGSQERLVEASAASLRLSQARYQGGVDTYLNALDAQRTLLTAQQGMIAARLQRATNLVTLYRTLGGGVR